MVALPMLDSGTFAASHTTEGTGDDGVGSDGLGSSDAGADGDGGGVGSDGWDVQPAARTRAATRTAAMRVEFMIGELCGRARSSIGVADEGSVSLVT
jgi:hypothetical protein